MAAEQSDSWSLYPYDPVKPLPFIFAAIVLALGVIHGYLSFVKYRWAKFGFMLTWASSVWLAGFVCRAISIYNVRSVGIFIAQYTMILTGPPLYAASEYFILGRLLAYLPYHAPLHPGRVLSTFLILSGTVEGLTANGAAISVGTDRKPSQIAIGNALIKAALILQDILEIFFISLVALIEYRCRRAKQFPRNVRVVCYVLYVTSLMMLLRCVFRTYEGFAATSCDPNAPGYDGYCSTVQRHEWFLWVFEVANIAIFKALLAIFNPGAYLPKSTKVYLDPADGVTHRIGPGFSKADTRPWWVTVLDPFDLRGILTGKGRAVQKFWSGDDPVYEGAIGHAKTSPE